MITNRNEWISNALALACTAALAFVLHGFSLPAVEEVKEPEPLGMEISMASVDAAPPAEPPVTEPPKEETPPPPDEPPPPPDQPPPPLPEPEPAPPPPVPEALPEQTPEVVTPPPVVEPPKVTPPKPEPPKPPPPPKPQQPPKPRPEPVRAAETAPVRSTASASASASASAAAAFRSCLAAAPYPQSKDARLQKPAGVVGISISGGVVTITKSSGSQILDQAARSRAGSCAESAGAATLSGSINYIPR